MKRKITTFLLAGLALVFVAFLVSILTGPRTLDQYNQLQTGLSKDQIESIFDNKPDYRCRYKDYEIWYFAKRGPFVPPIPQDKYEPNYLYQSSDQLPDVYGYVTIAFDRTNKVYAYTWIGETYTVDFVGGSVKGTHFSLIPPETF